MMDFEVLKTKDHPDRNRCEYVMQVQGKFFVVPNKYRNMNRVKLMHLHGKGEFQPVKPKGL